MHELIPSDENTSCFNNFQGGSSQAYAVTADDSKVWLATASEDGYTVDECGDFILYALLTRCDNRPITCSSPVSSYTPTNIPSPTGGEDKSISISGEGTFVVGLPDSNKVYVSTVSNSHATPLELGEETSDPPQQFGRCVDITEEGDLVAVGAPMTINAPRTMSTGRVYMFEKGSNTKLWSETALLQPPTGVEVNEFGKRIGFSDDDKVLAVVSNESIFIYQKALDAPSTTLVVALQYQLLLFNSGPWTEFSSIEGNVANFDEGVSIMKSDSSLVDYTVYGKDDGGNVIALDVSLYESLNPYQNSPCGFPLN